LPKNKNKIKIIEKEVVGEFSISKEQGKKEKESKNRQIQILGFHCVAKKDKRMIKVF
jgi:hypothetical protein